MRVDAMFAVVVLVTLCAGCEPTFDEACEGFCNTIEGCLPADYWDYPNQCENQLCYDGAYDDAGDCAHELWDYYICVSDATCSEFVGGACESELGPCHWDRE